MEAVVEGLWRLADLHEENGEVGKAVKCLEAICQSEVSVLPILEVKTRLRIAYILLKHSNNVNHAKSHLERSQLLLKSIPSCFELKCRAYSLLSQCYHLVGAIPPQKQILNKGIELAESAGHGPAGKLWFCNFICQLANTLVIEGDYHNSISALERAQTCTSEACHFQLQMFFACSILHVHLMQWDNMELVGRAVRKCEEAWELISVDKREECFGIYIYCEFLRLFYLLRICDYKTAGQHVDKLDAAMRADLERYESQVHNDVQETNEAVSDKEIQRERKDGRASGSREPQPLHFGNFSWGPSDKIELVPAPINGSWLPKNAVYALVDLMVVINNRPKGLFKECTKRIHSGLRTIQGELKNLGIVDGSNEVQLQHSAIWMAGVYLMLLVQFLENKVAVELTRSEFVEAQEALVQMINWYARFPTILQASECRIEMLRGQYAHCIGCFHEAAFHFIEATKLTDSLSTQALCQVYAGVSYICIGDAESSSQALDLIGPILNTMDSYVGVREKTCVLFAHGFLLMKQQDLQDARIRLASGLQITHNHLGNFQLVSQYLAILGTIALALHDTGQAREILRSSFTLAKKLYDVPTQAWILSVLTDMYQKTGEKEHEMENFEYQKKKEADLKKRLSAACSSIHHVELVDMKRLEAEQLNRLDMKRVAAESSMRVGLDIPESIGLITPSPANARHLKRLSSGHHGNRKI